ncbi:hypothetical protein [Microlunatus sp. GCM10028923]|uniref:hypothetical protein n=1 Tax=Microlunatus sp. GCM10028923 TaxID=3273400 RepID=UPI00360E2F84
MQSKEFKPLQLDRRAFVRAAGIGAAGLAVPGALAACSTEGSGPEKPGGIENVEQKQLGADTPGVVYPDGYVGPKASQKEPFSDGSKTFKVVVQVDAEDVGDWSTNKFSAWLEKRTGVKIEYVQVLVTGSDGSVDMTKINAMLASNELPDAFLNIPFTSDQVSLYGQQGLFVALQDYIETYAPEARRMRDEYPDFPALNLAQDGNTYWFRGINDCFHCRVSPGRAFVNQKYLDAVGAKIPTTTEELRTVLKALKDNDPSPGKNIIPFGASLTNPLDRFVMNAFLYNPGGDRNGGWLRLNEGKVEFVADKPEWREGLRFLRTLFDDGTLPKTSFTMPQEALLKAGNTGRFGVMRGYWWGSFMDLEYKEDALWHDYVPVPPLKGPGGVQYAAWDHYGYAAGNLVITSKCSNPELLVQWADAQMELEAVMGGYGGIKDDNWGWAKEGDEAINGKQATWYSVEFPAPQGTSWDQHSVMYRSNDFRLGQWVDPKQPTFEKDLYEASLVYEPHQQPKDFQLPPLLFDESSAAQKAETAAAIELAVKEALAKFSTGELDVNDDAAWDTYVKKFETMGMPAYLELYQQAYDNRPK